MSLFVTRTFSLIYVSYLTIVNNFLCIFESTGNNIGSFFEITSLLKSRIPVFDNSSMLWNDEALKQIIGAPIFASLSYKLLNLINDLESCLTFASRSGSTK